MCTSYIFNPFLLVVWKSSVYWKYTVDFGGGLEGWVLRYLGEGDLVVFWKWVGFGVVNEVSYEIDLKF